MKESKTEVTTENFAKEETKKQSKQTATATPNRKHRRLLQKYQGIHKMKRKLPLNEWREQIRFNLKDGKNIQSERKDKIDKYLSEVYNDKLASRTKVWEEIGYSKSAIYNLKKAFAILFESVDGDVQESRRDAKEYLKKANSSLK